MFGFKQVATGVGTAAACLFALVGCADQIDRGDTESEIALHEEQNLEVRGRDRQPGDDIGERGLAPRESTATTAPTTAWIAHHEEQNLQIRGRDRKPGDDIGERGLTPRESTASSAPTTTWIAVQEERQLRSSGRSKLPIGDIGNRTIDNPGRTTNPPLQAVTGTLRIGLTQQRTLAKRQGERHDDSASELPGPLSSLAVDVVGGWRLIGPPPSFASTLPAR